MSLRIRKNTRIGKGTYLTSSFSVPDWATGLLFLFYIPVAIMVFIFKLMWLCCVWFFKAMWWVCVKSWFGCVWCCKQLYKLIAIAIEKIKENKK